MAGGGREERPAPAGPGVTEAGPEEGGGRPDGAVVPAGGQEEEDEGEASGSEGGGGDAEGDADEGEDAASAAESAGSGPSESDPPVRSASSKKRRDPAGPAPWVSRTLRLVDTAPNMAAAASAKWRALRKSKYMGAWGFPAPAAWAHTWSPAHWRRAAQGLLGRWAKEARALAADPRAGLWLGACGAAVCGVFAWRQHVLLSELRAQHIELMQLTRQVENSRQQ